MQFLKAICQGIRLPILFAGTGMPVIYGGSLSFIDGHFKTDIFLLVLTTALLIHAATTIINDYYDYYNGTDVINQEVTPYNAGSRVIIEGKLTPAQVIKISICFYTAGAIGGLYLYLLCGWPIILFGLLGIFLSYAYSAPPFKLSHRGLGEVTVGFCFGPLVICTTYYTLTEGLNPEVFFAALPVGFLVAGILFINEIPDYQADKTVAKCNWVVRLGKKRAVKGYGLILLSVYLLIISDIIFKVIPKTAFLALLTVPMGLSIFKATTRDYSITEKLAASCAGTIKLHVLTSSLLIVGILINYLL